MLFVEGIRWRWLSEMGPCDGRIYIHMHIKNSSV